MSIGLFRGLLSEATRLGRRKNALSPIAWPCTAGMGLAGWLARESDGALRYCFFALAAGLAGLFAFACIYLLVADRPRLQTEEFNLMDRALDIFEAKGEKLKITEAGLHSIIANPHPAEPSLRGPISGGDPRP